MLGPYLANHNDAEILKAIIEDQNGLYKFLKKNDVFVLDRGFRDVVKDLEEKNIRVLYVCMYIILTPRRVASFFERFSPFTHTILYRYRLINRCQPVPVRFSGPELVAPHLELALDAQL